MPPARASAGSRQRNRLLSRDRGQVDGEGEDEQRLRGLLEGGLGVVGGGEVGEGDHRGGDRAPAGAQRPQRAQRRQPGHHPDRDDLAEEGLGEADSRHRRRRHRQPVRSQRVAGVWVRPEAAAQPLRPGEVQAEIVVEAHPEQAPAAADRERDRQRQQQHDGHRQTLAPCPPAGAEAPPDGRRGVSGGERLGSPQPPCNASRNQRQGDQPEGG